jgi:hypothetical protein
MTTAPVQPPNTSEEEEGLGDPLLEHRIAAAADLARAEDRLRTAAMRAFRAWTTLVRTAVLGPSTVTAAACSSPIMWGQRLVFDLARQLGITLRPVAGDLLPARLIDYPDPSAVTAAAGDPPPPEPEPLPPPAPLPPEVNAIPLLSAQWSQILTDTIDAELAGMLGDVFAQYLAEPAVISARPWQDEYIQTVHNRLAGVADQTFDLVRDAVTEAQTEGRSIPELRDLVQDILVTRGETTWAGRAETIARTESTAGWNGGRLQAWKVLAAEDGEAMDRVWISTIDERTRLSHWRADGQRVPLDGKFLVGDAHLDHPGDPHGPPEETIRCRCSMLILRADEPTPDTADRQLRPPGEVQQEIDRRAAEGQIRAYDDPELARTAAALTPPPDHPTPPGRDTDTAAGYGPGATFVTEGTPMPRTWESDPYLAPFAEPTGDGRIFKAGSLRARDLPLHLLFQQSSASAHDGSVTVGRITAVQFTDAGIVASGDYLDDESVAADVNRAVALTESGLGHVSVDLGAVTAELVDEAGNPVDWDTLFEAWERGEDIAVLEQVTDGELIAVTQVATPAFASAKIRLTTAVAALTDAAGTGIGVGDTVDVDTGQDTIRGRVTAVDEPNSTVTVQPVDADGNDTTDAPLSVAPAAVTVITPAPVEAAPAAVEAADLAAELVEAAPALAATLTAGVGPLRPDRAWFNRQPLTGPTAMTITDDGQIFGHVAQWGQCHVGFTNTCWTAPTSATDYAYFHVGEVVCDDGEHVAVGNLTLGPRHADARLGYRAAVEHYDSANCGVAVVRCYEDDYGIQFAGALTPGVTAEQLYDLRRCPVSGDWRKIGGQLDLIGVLSVNSGGYPTPRFATDDYGRTALVAAPGVPVPELDSTLGRTRRPVLTQAQLMAKIKAEIRAEMAADDTRRRRLASAATSIRRDPRSRLDELAARVTP